MTASRGKGFSEASGYAWAVRIRKILPSPPAFDNLKIVYHFLLEAKSGVDILNPVAARQTKEA